MTTVLELIAFAGVAAGAEANASAAAGVPWLDVLLTGFVVSLLPVCVLRPWIGVLLFAWLGYMNPHRLLDGFAYEMPFAKMVAAATLLGLVFTKERYPLPRVRAVYLTAGFWLVCVASTVLVARQPEVAWEKLSEFTKILVMTGATLVLIQDRRKVVGLLFVIALSIGYYGIAGGIPSFLSGFSDRLWGPPDSFLADNNALGYIFTIALPLFALLRYQTDNRWWRALLLAMFATSIVGVFATYSRGAFIGLCIVLPLVLLLTRTRDLALWAATLAACLAIQFAPEKWVERMETITPTVYKDDGSGAERMKSWYVAFRLGLDHPLLGAGFRPFEPDVYEMYLPGYWDHHDSHNHYLQVFGEHGLTGLVLFVALMVTLFQSLWRTYVKTRGDPQRKWIHDAVPMLAASLVAYAVGGVFLNMPYFDLYYQLGAIAVILAIAAESEDEVVAEPQGSLVMNLWNRLRPSS